MVVPALAGSPLLGPPRGVAALPGAGSQSGHVTSHLTQRHTRHQGSLEPLAAEEPVSPRRRRTSVRGNPRVSSSEPAQLVRRQSSSQSKASLGTQALEGRGPRSRSASSWQRNPEAECLSARLACEQE